MTVRYKWEVSEALYIPLYDAPLSNLAHLYYEEAIVKIYSYI